MKTISVVNAYQVLNEAKLTKMDDADKFKVIKSLRRMKQVAGDFNSFLQTAREKLQGEDHEERLQQAREWDQKHRGQTVGDLAPEEAKTYEELNKYMTEYSNRVQACVKEEQDKDVELDAERLTEEAFGKLVASNDWTCGQIMELADVIC